MRKTKGQTDETVVESEPMFLRIRAVIRVTGLGRSTIYRFIADKTFPGPVRLGPRAVAWRQSDLDRWSSNRPAARNPEP